MISPQKFSSLFSLSLMLQTIVVLTTTVSVLPNASAEDKAAYYRIRFNELEGESGPPMDDGDKVDVIETPSSDRNVKYITLQLKTSRPMWWKAVTLYDPVTKKHENIVEISDAGNNELITKRIEYADFRAKKLCLSKAKALGVKADMYQVTDHFRNMHGGKVYTFVWHKD